jgi:hypothetical protein
MIGSSYGVQREWRVSGGRVTLANGSLCSVEVGKVLKTEWRSDRRAGPLDRSICTYVNPHTERRVWASKAGKTSGSNGVAQE